MENTNLNLLFWPRRRTWAIAWRYGFAITASAFPPEVKDKMFNPFFTTKPAGEGTGLGLSISHDIVVKQHGGTIEVDTEAGEFTEFQDHSASQCASSADRENRCERAGTCR